MARIAPLLLLALLATPTALADIAPPAGSVWTVFTTVEAVVRDNYATVKVIADIRNQGPDPEFPFQVRVPDDAFVTGLTIERDGTVHEAHVKDRAEAREEYEAWKAKEQTGGLVEKTRRTSVYAYLINVAEFTNVRATLTYERYLVADRGVYNVSLEAPVSGFGRDLGARFDVRVSDTSGVVALWGDPAGVLHGDTLTYEVGPRRGVEYPTPFTASFTPAPTGGAGSLLTHVANGQGFFAHRFRAPADAKELPMDLVLVLDVSGSMAGLKLTQMIDAAKQVIATLRDEDRLHLVAFSTDARSSWQGLRAMTPDARRAAAREVDSLFDAGGTNIGAGLEAGFSAFQTLERSRDEGRYPALVLLTDGKPTAGPTSSPALRDIARERNEHDAAVFGIAFGDDADWALIRHLAHDGEGAAIRVPTGHGAEVDLRRFMAALTTPVLRDVRLHYSDGVHTHTTYTPVLLAGSELLVVGTYDPAKGIRGHVTGRSPEGLRNYSFAGGTPATQGFLPRLVAYHEIRALQEQEDAGEATRASTARIRDLALSHGFVTDHTSLVLTLPPRDARPWTPADGDARSGAPAVLDSSGCQDCTAPASARHTRGYTTDSTSIQPLGGGDPHAPYAGTTPPAPTTPGAEPAPETRVPAPGLWALILALGALALARRRSAR